MTRDELIELLKEAVDSGNARVGDRLGVAQDILAALDEAGLAVVPVVAPQSAQRVGADLVMQLEAQKMTGMTFRERAVHAWDAVLAAGRVDQPTSPAEQCQHEWTDMRNRYVESGEWCPKCNAVRPGPAAGRADQ